jgi:hypothetical protein
MKIEKDRNVGNGSGGEVMMMERVRVSGGGVYETHCRISGNITQAI